MLTYWWLLKLKHVYFLKMVADVEDLKLIKGFITLLLYVEIVIT